MMRDMPDGSRQPSIIYNGCLDDDYQPMQFDDETLDWLRRGGVRRVISGHLPNGDAPLIIRMSPDIDVIAADITYAGQVSWVGDEQDGGAPSTVCPAVCEVCVELESHTCFVHGSLSNGLSFEAKLDDPVVGRTTVDGWRVKGRTDSLLVLSKNEKWEFQSRLARDEEVQFT